MRTEPMDAPGPAHDVARCPCVPCRAARAKARTLPAGQGAARQAAHAGRAAPPDAPNLDRTRALANAWRQLRAGRTVADAENFVERYDAADASVRRSMCLEVD